METAVVVTGEEGDGEAIAETTMEISFQGGQAITTALTFSAETITRHHTTATAITLGTTITILAGDTTEATFFQEEIAVEIVGIAYLAIATTTIRGTSFQGATTTPAFLATITTIIQGMAFLETITRAIFSATTTITTIISSVITTTEAAISSATTITTQGGISLTTITTIAQIRP